MKPHELIAALMAREGLGALPLAKKMGKPKLQPQIHRFIHGEVAEPARSTAAPLAAYFQIPIEAVYEEKTATLVANELKLTVLPVPPPAPRRRAAQSKEVKELLAKIADVEDETERSHAITVALTAIDDFLERERVRRTGRRAASKVFEPVRPVSEEPPPRPRKAPAPGR
jgi:hypothetical protein